MLPSARARRQDFAAREAAGHSVWTTEFDERALVRMRAAWHWIDNRYDIGATVASILRIQGGWDFGQHVDSRSLTYDLSPTVRLDMLAAVAMAAELRADPEDAEQFVNIMNALMNEHRIAYKFVEGELIGFESDELLQEVVEPTLRLLVGDQFKDAHASYLDALKEISDGKPDDAITDAGRALQQTLEALGCEGNVLSKLIEDAKQKNLFKPHDEQLHQAFITIMKWAASERNKVGDAHQDGGAQIADAWFIVHVVGAIIVRLADPARRGSTA